MGLKPGYKQTEVGIIPEDWELLPLGDGIKLLSGQHVLARYCNTDGDGVPYLTGPADFPNGAIQHTKFTTKPGKLCRASDVLVTVKGSGAGTSVLADADYCISRQLMAIRVTEWDTSYIYFLLLRDAAVFGEAATGLIPGLSRSDILNKLIPLPRTRTEQEAIAEALSDADALVESLEQLIAKKSDLKQGVMQDLLTGKKRLPGFRGEWEVKTLGTLVRTHNSGIYKSEEFYGRGSNILGVSDLYQMSAVSGQVFAHVPLTDEERSKYTLLENDLLYGESSLVREGIARTVYVTKEGSGTAFAWHTRRYRIDQRALRSDFLCYYLASSLARKHMVDNCIQTAITGINTSSYFACPVPVPSLREQCAIAAILSDMDAEIAALEAKLTKARQINQGMMQELLTGKIRLV